MSPSNSSSSNCMKQAKKSTFLDLTQSYPVFDQLCIHLRIREIINLTRTCKALSHLYQTLLSLQQWNVDRNLLRFVKDPRRFRSQLGKCDGLISGSFALQFFERVYWKESDLDIFIEVGEEARKFEHYMTNVEGYRLTKESFNNGYAWSDLSEV